MHSSDFSTLYQSSYSYIYQLVFSVSQNHQTVEDTVQEIYLAAWLRFRDNSHPNPFGWLVLTARHKACDMIRRQIRDSKRCVPMDMTTDFLPSDASLVSSISGFENGEPPYSQIRPLLREDEFQLILAHYEQGFSVNELADELQISPSACYMRLHRARRKLSSLVSSDAKN